MVRASGAATLLIEVSPDHPDGSTTASIKIEKLTQGPSSAHLPNRSHSGDLDVRDLQVIGHLAGIGDVMVGPGQWLAGPSAPSRIEGIAISWPSMPPDLNVRYAVKLSKPLPISGHMVDLGAFAGTRGRGLPITGMVLKMSGPGASRCRFVVEAAVLGSPIKRLIGRRIALSGPTDREALVGLRVNIEAVAAGPLAPEFHLTRSGQSGHTDAFAPSTCDEGGSDRAKSPVRSNSTDTEQGALTLTTGAVNVTPDQSDIRTSEHHQPALPRTGAAPPSHCGALSPKNQMTSHGDHQVAAAALPQTQ